MLQLMEGTRVKTHVPLSSPGRRGTPIKPGTKGTILPAPEEHRHVIPWQIKWDRIKLPRGCFWGVRETLAIGVELLEPCEACKKETLASEIVWLERSTAGSYHAAGTLPEDKLQGSFAFGKTCARKALDSF